MPLTYNGNTPTTITWNGNELDYVTWNGTTVWQKTAPPTVTGSIKFSSANSFSIKPQGFWNGTVEYSLDNSTWNTATEGTAVASDTNNTIYFRGTGNSRITGVYSQTGGWQMAGTNIRCEGNIENLLDYETVLNGNHPSMDAYCFSNLFYNCNELVSAPELAATTLSNWCYFEMFYNCQKLASAPALPATDLALARACYLGMFSNCTSLTAAPELPATTLSQECYKQMFQGCTSLETPPQLLATNLANECYSNMFSNCTSLRILPLLPATTLADYCYANMFVYCSRIRVSETQSENYPYAYRLPTSGTGTVTTDSLYKMFEETGGSFTGTPSINTTYYTYRQSI